MNAVFGAVILAAGVGLVVAAVPRQGMPRPFLRGTFRELMFPVLCLALLVVGGAMLVAGVSP